MEPPRRGLRQGFSDQLLALSQAAEAFRRRF